MVQLTSKLATSENPVRCFGLRIESRLLQLAIATPRDDGRWDLEIDHIQCATSAGWMTAAGTPLLVEALETLQNRHDMRRHLVAVSLDGDFCVTRVTMGAADEVDRELSTLADRVPRYLQLGPGEKVTGSTRKTIAPSVDYAVTGVANRSLIRLLYDALRETDVRVAWVEPSLVSMARLVGQAKIGGEQPIMLADGTGHQWDVGIACSGRLLLDYRPAAATNEIGLRDALDGHITRLKRFCQRHRRVATGELSRVLICGFGEKPNRTVEILGSSLGVTPEVLRVPRLPELYEIDEENCHSSCVPAVATVLPLLTGVSHADVPDLLTEIRRAPDLPWFSKAIRVGWPAIAASIMLAAAFGLVSGQRRQNSGCVQSRAEIQMQIESTQAKFASLSQQRELLSHLTQIEQKSRETNWDLLLGRITQSLPDSCRLNEYRVESDGQVLLDGTVLDELIVYELVNSLRGLPGVKQVALSGTAPESATGGTRFQVRLTTSKPRNTIVDEDAT